MLSRRILIGVIPALAALAGLTGCATHAPATDPQPIFDMPAAYTAGPETPISQDAWWLEFDDPVLTALIESALSNNLSLAQAVVRIHLADTFVRQARANRLPAVGLDAEAERRWERLLDLDTSGEPSDLDQLESIVNQIYASAEEAAAQTEGATPGGNPGGGTSIVEEIAAQQDTGEDERFDADHWESEYGTGLAFSWELDLWGRLRALAQARRADWDAVVADYESLRLILTAQVAETYYEALEQRLQLDLLADQRKLAETFLELLELRFLQGSASSVDVLQQRDQLAEIDSEMPVVLSELGALENRLDVLIGSPPDGVDRTAHTDAALPNREALPAIAVPAALLQNRPDLRALQRQVVSNDYEIAAAIAERLPQVSLSGSFAFNNVASEPALNAAGAVSLLQPLVDWGLRKAAVDAARASFRESLLAFSDAYLVAIEEVETSLWREARQRELIDALARREGILQSTVEESRVRYSLGVTDYLPVLTALQDLQDVQRELIFQRRALVSLRIQLFRAIGGATGETSDGLRALASGAEAAP